MKFRGNCVLLLVLCQFFTDVSGIAQGRKTPTGPLAGAVIPISLQQSLKQRLDQFIIAQKEGRWDDVALLMGDFRSNSNGRRYTQEQKKCLIEQMKASPLAIFDYKKTGFSTEILGMPLSRKWWYIIGETGASSDAFKKKQVTITAYRASGKWFFSPPNLDDEWVRERISEEDLKADFSKYLQVIVPLDCPVELLDLSVHIDPKFLSLRNVQFKVRNRSRKAVRGFSFKIIRSDENGGISVGTGLHMEPGEVVDGPTDLNYSAYLFYCEGEQHRRLIMDSVEFVDGAQWKLRTGLRKHYKRSQANASNSKMAAAFLAKF